MSAALHGRLGDHPAELNALRLDVVLPQVMQHTPGESRQIQDIRRRFVHHLAEHHVQTERVNLVSQAQHDLAEGGKTYAQAHLPPSGHERSATHARLRQRVATRRSDVATATPSPQSTAHAPDLQNPFETTAAASGLPPEVRGDPVVSPNMPAPIEGGMLETETQEDHDRLDNDLLNQPATPDFDTILFSPETVSAFLDTNAHAHALGMVKELLQQKDLIAKRNFAERVRKDPNDTARGAQLFGNVPGLARYMPEDLREFSIDLVPGAAPVRQGMRRFTQEETAEIRKQVEKMLTAGVIEACRSPFASGVVLARKKDGS